jgi:hypothetical protein
VWSRAVVVDITETVSVYGSELYFYLQIRGLVATKLFVFRWVEKLMVGGQLPNFILRKTTCSGELIERDDVYEKPSRRDFVVKYVSAVNEKASSIQISSRNCLFLIRCNQSTRDPPGLAIRGSDWGLSTLPSSASQDCINGRIQRSLRDIGSPTFMLLVMWMFSWDEDFFACLSIL